MGNSNFNTNGLDDLNIHGFSTYIKPVRLLLLCDSGLISYLKLKSWYEELIYTQMIGYPSLPEGLSDNYFLSWWDGMDFEGGPSSQKTVG